MKLSDIAIAVANNPNALWKLNNRSGYYRITGFGERKVGQYGNRSVRKTVLVEGVCYLKAIAEGEHNYWHEPQEAREASVSTYEYGDFLPSQIDGLAYGWLRVEGQTDSERIQLTMDNLIDYEVRHAKEDAEIRAEWKRTENDKVQTLQNFLGDSYEVVPMNLTSEYYKTDLINAIIDKLKENNQ